ncbi:MAG: BlaI/MecI/CopY family transcriptional regulator [Clostridia bacterium]|nr:BlaI/MecI/CopY family transcriptional regulator [Clostridia bacterium]MDD4681149.1 BlaI/MecI/CopY family transcriptional regulator [Clostridia bacterium]
MSKYPNLSNADSTIMEILWRDGGAASSEIQEEVKEVLNWSRQTVNTYLNRLMEKGLVGTEEINKRLYRYYPVVSRNEYAADKANGVINKYYGNLTHMVAGFVENDKITDSDLDELESLIQELKGKGGK